MYFEPEQNLEGLASPENINLKVTFGILESAARKIVVRPLQGEVRLRDDPIELFSFSNIRPHGKDISFQVRFV